MTQVCHTLLVDVSAVNYETHLNKILPDEPNKNCIKKLVITKIEQASLELFAKIRDKAVMDSRARCPTFRAKVDFKYKIPVQVLECISANLESKHLFRINFQTDKYIIDDFLPSNWFINDTEYYEVGNISVSWMHDNRLLFPDTETCDSTKASHMRPFWEAAQKGDGTDVIFKVKDKQFQAHRTFVKQHSPVVEALLTKMKEADQLEIEIQGDDPRWFFCLLYYIYNCSLPPETEVNRANWEKIYTIADKYDVKSLRILAKENLLNSLLTTEISKENFSDVFRLASKFGSEVLLERCLNFVRMNPQGMNLLMSQILQNNEMHEEELRLILNAALLKVTAP